MADLSGVSTEDLVKMLSEHPDVTGQQVPAQPQQPNTAVDVVRSIPGGLTQGLADVAGFPGLIPQGINYGLSKIGQLATGRTEEQRVAHEAEIAKNRFLPEVPTSSTIAEPAAALFGGFYKPKTMAGDYASSIVRFAPSVFAGPGSLLLRGARAVVPAVTSETAGQLTKDTPYEPYARGVTALATGLGMGFGEGIAAERAQSAQVPTTAQVRTIGGNQYQSFASRPVTLTPEATTALSDQFGTTAIRAALTDAQLNHETAIVNELQGLLNANPAARPAQLRTDTADKIRQAFDSLADSAPRPNTSRGWEHRSDAMETSVQQTPDINDARNTWAQFRKSQTIDKAMARAADRAGTPAGFGDPAQAMRKEFLRIQGSKEFARFTPAEQDAIKAVGNGTLTADILQQLGKFSPVRGHITRWLELGGAMAGHGLEALAAAAGGELARQGSNFATARAARLASELVRSGGTTRPQLAVPFVRQGVTAGILSDRRAMDDSYAARISALAAQP